MQQYIDNKCGIKRIGLKTFTYTIGWYNLIDEYITKGTNDKINITSGFYSFQQIADIFQSNNIVLYVNETNGIVFLTSTVDLKISKGLKEMLGLGNKRRFNANQTYEGEIPLNFAPYKQLYIHLEQINSAYNFFDGAPSNILGVVPVENKSFGDIIHTHFSNPEYKQLAYGDISELSISVCDENGQKINNNGLPINCVLEII
ncbi:MAG: hypothetical protein AB2608_12730 [Candidatus Thiodiazotropha sp.]